MKLEDDMRRIREVILLMGGRVETAIARAVFGLVERRGAVCTGVIRGDAEVNRLQAEVRDLCFTVVLMQAPVAGDLREVLGFFHMAAELERMGDHCVSIAKIARRLADLPPLTPPVDIPLLAERCSEQVHDVLGAVVARDVGCAQRVAARDDRVDRIHARLFDELLERMASDGSTAYCATNLVFVAHHLERIADRATNLAEDLIFLETGALQELG